jgi:hypothetical protein
MRAALYTAIYGDSDWVKPVPDIDVPCYLYTEARDTAMMAQMAGWETRVVPHSIATLKGDPKLTAPMMAHKFWKTHPELACPDADISIWIDGSMEVLASDFILACLTALGTDDWACVRHPARNCIYPEAEYSATLKWRYDSPSILAQSKFYSSFHPRDWGLFATGHNVRRHTPEVIELGHQWWDECLNWSHQDQLSLPVLMRLADYKVKYNYNLPWHTWWKLYQHGQR